MLEFFRIGLNRNLLFYVRSLFSTSLRPKFLTLFWESMYFFHFSPHNFGVACISFPQTPREFLLPFVDGILVYATILLVFTFLPLQFLFVLSYITEDYTVARVSMSGKGEKYILSQKVFPKCFSGHLKCSFNSPADIFSSRKN